MKLIQTDLQELLKDPPPVEVHPYAIYAPNREIALIRYDQGTTSYATYKTEGGAKGGLSKAGDPRGFYVNSR